jgi:hypothetical protein
MVFNDYRGRHGRDLMQSVPITTYFVSSNTAHGVLDIILSDKVCHRLVTGRWFSPGIPVSSINKADSDYITEILLKVGLSTINTHILY